MSASTHSLPLSILARYLILEINCTVTLLGIQPGSNDVGEDEDISVENLILGKPSGESQKSFKKWLQARAQTK